MILQLYHRILPENHTQYVSPNNILKEGITYRTASNLVYMNVGKNNTEILEKYRPTISQEWIDFNKAIGADLAMKGSNAFVFPSFTDKILVFDADIVNQIYDQEFYNSCGDIFEEAENFDTGMNLDALYRKYWSSMMSLENYLQNRQYDNPQILIFESIPSNIIRIASRQND